jgi:heme exporter protein B
MMMRAHVAAKIWWLIHKDLVSECRTRQVWPAMLLFGIVVALIFSVQMDLPPQQQRQILGGLLWLAIFFAGMIAMDRSLAAEREEGCWEGLLLYPVPPAAIYIAKLAVNSLALAASQCVLIALFAVLADAPLLAHPGAMLLVAVLGNLGLAAVGTALSAVAAAARQGGSLLGLLALPMAVPVVFAAAEATRLIAENDLQAEWWRWIQLLAAFAAVFITMGAVLFGFVVEE